MSQSLELTNPISGHKRHVIYDGPDKPRAVMLICHGFGEHCERYEPMMSHLAENGIATLAIDLEGHGQTQGRKGVCRDYNIFHADIALLSATATGQYSDIPAFLYGHSMGGGLVLNHGLKHGTDSFKGVMVSAPLIHPTEPVPGPLRLIVKLLRPVLPNMTIGNPIPGSKVSSIPDEQVKYENDPLNHDRLGLGLAADMIEGGEWVAERAGDWTAPLLLMHAKNDQLTKFESSREFAERAENCTFMPLADCEHEIHNDVTREQVYAAMIKFMEQNL